MLTKAQSSVLKQETNVEQKNNAHVGEQKVDFPKSETISDDGNPSRVDDFPDLPNLFVETETLNWEEIINLDREKLQRLQSERHSLKELFKITNK